MEYFASDFFKGIISIFAPKSGCKNNKQLYFPDISTFGSHNEFSLKMDLSKITPAKVLNEITEFFIERGLI